MLNIIPKKTPRPLRCSGAIFIQRKDRCPEIEKMPRNISSHKRFRSEIMNFLFPLKIGRGEYFLRNLVLGVVISLPLGLLKIYAQRSGISSLLMIHLFLLIASCIFCLWFSVIPRINDAGVSPKLAVLIFIPIVSTIFGLALLFTPSNETQQTQEPIEF